ncbi:Potassium efflux system kefA / Small-conductance mechanosensitive channel [Pseudonocardia sp. Ae168_Ps1]|uniref:mechanosensitive ion channel family protein n=1 Tax=unclassified Pseudonocardia TaxID=2619320 RepID=UPI000969923B|nr:MULTISPECIES: mechanosensitive ion channel family protein [unclassified Pseudonocardia]OLL76362.1 Potassium efflux system kefA / Small-conductance mechanosensitive channel [Pseudonocardia sp. Ae150A_Ps1]OLL82372.1 Potassium efflux system kefA / Small-conductance mechanosensitive channel [Pseudonocardia sp. Ae168_Ps1]OLL83512.1 Potassium efflux system kefA / Small-conductance mechanosensitive channel [Pseudonocardia sp. Ae263_Ps1]OLL90449.1 Potassium efflux system kefA / Small-conductance mec
MTIIPPVPDRVVPALMPDCVQNAGSWCSTFYRWTSNDFLAQHADTIVSKTFSIGTIVVFAVLFRWVAHRAIARMVDGATNGRFSALVGRARRLRRTDGARRAGDSPGSQRRMQRARTIGSVLRSIVSAVVLLVAVMMVMNELGYPLGPLLAGAGVLGLAIGFGAQNLVRDFLSGMFMLLEDQYGVGDIVDLGEAVGTVEAVGLRITTIRELQGTVWYVRNGEILRVGNMSQGYAVAVVDLPVAHSADVEEATEIAGTTATERVAQDDVAGDVLEPPEVLGVDRIGPEGVTLRITVRVSPGRQWAVQRALNGAITDAFDDHGIPRPLLFGGAGLDKRAQNQN